MDIIDAQEGRGLRTGFIEGIRSRSFAWEAVIVLVGGIACVALTGYFGMRFNRPGGVLSDHLFIVTDAKNYIEGHGFRFNPSLGFPDRQDYLYFPSFDLTQRLFLWLMAFVSRNPFFNVHAYYIVGLVAMFGCSYWGLRWLGARWWIAAAGAVACVVEPYLNMRAYGHDFLALYYSAPMGCALAIGIGAGLRHKRLRDFLTEPFVIVTMVVTASSGLYYAFFAMMFVAFAGVAAAVLERRWLPLMAGAAACAIMLAILIFSGFGFDLFNVPRDAAALHNRAAYEELFYGLDLGWAAFPFTFLPSVKVGLGASVALATREFSNGPEWPGLLLTLILLASPLIAAAMRFTPQKTFVPRARRLNVVRFAALCSVFGMLYGVRGGLGFIFSLFVSPEIRAPERIIPFLTFAAAVIVCMAAEIAFDLRRPWLRYGLLALLGAGLVITIAPSIGGLARRQQAALAEPSAAAMRRSVVAMLKRKDHVGARAVLELPVVKWPEAPLEHAFDPYDHLLPYVYDRHGSPTRWSYGAAENQPSQARLRALQQQPATLASQARTMQFDAVLIQKSAYAPADLAQLEAAMGRQLAPPCKAYEDETLVFYSLTKGPAGEPCRGAGA